MNPLFTCIRFAGLHIDVPSCETRAVYIVELVIEMTQQHSKLFILLCKGYYVSNSIPKKSLDYVIQFVNE